MCGRRFVQTAAASSGGLDFWGEIFIIKMVFSLMSCPPCRNTSEKCQPWDVETLTKHFFLVRFTFGQKWKEIKKFISTDRILWKWPTIGSIHSRRKIYTDMNFHSFSMASCHLPHQSIKETPIINAFRIPLNISCPHCVCVCVSIHSFH